eukprot:g75409.t1
MGTSGSPDPRHWVLLTSGVFAGQTNRKRVQLGAIDPSDTGCWEPQQPAGIRNFGNTCYLNTALQAIAPMLAEAGVDNLLPECIAGEACVVCSLRRIMDRKIRTQSAMNEDLHTVVTRLHEWEDWPGEIKNDGTGGGCTVQELVDHHFRDDIVTDYYCSQCCEGAARRTVTQRREIIQEEGPVWLAIAVARVCLQGYAQRKVVREVKVSSIVNIPVTNQAGTVQITPYQVAALGNHEGSGSAAGHYVVYTSMPVRGFESLRTMYLRLIVLKRMVNAQPASLLVYNRKQPLSSNLIMSAQTSSPVVGLSNSGGAGGASGSPSQFIPRSRSSLVLPTSGTLKSLNTPPRTGSKACEMGNSSVSASLTSQAEEEPGRLHSDHACSSAKACVESKRVRRTIVQEREWSDALHDYDSIPKTNADTVREQRGVLELLKFAKLSECNLKIMESPSQARGSNDCFVFAIAIAVSLLHGLGPVRKDQYAGKNSVCMRWHLLSFWGFTDAEVEFTLQYMNLSDQLMFKPADNQQAKIATQTLLHMDCNVMSHQQVTNLLRASQHPWLTGAKLVTQRKDLTQEVIPKYDLEGEMLKTFESWEKEGWTSSATGIKYDVQLYVTGHVKWFRTVCGQKSAGADHICYMCLCHKNDRGDLSRMCHPMRNSATADKTTPGMAHHRSLFHFVSMNRHVPDLLHMMLRICGRMFDFLIREICDGRPDTSWGSDIPPDSPYSRLTNRLKHLTDILYNKNNIRSAPGSWQRIQSFWKAWWQQFWKINTPTPFEPAAALFWQSQTRKLFRDATSSEAQPDHPKIVSGEWKVERKVIRLPSSVGLVVLRTRTADIRLLHLRGFMLKEYKYRCTLCARRFVYQKCFKTHLVDCRQDEPDISDVINVDKSHFWEQCDFVAANEDD